MKKGKRRILIIGGAGFIGSNITDVHLGRGDSVTVLDNLCRTGSRLNLARLKEKHGRVTLLKADIIKDSKVLDSAARGMEIIYHFAGQVAVTRSVADPRHDFMTNALGTFNVLEAIRRRNPEALLLYSSTMRVYGKMAGEKACRSGDRYFFPAYRRGIPEGRALDFHTPYACSKGAADQYVLDYSRTYGLRTVVFRQSCIYGPGQFAIEDHGWVAWFLASALLDRPMRIFGDGRQVRDILYISDLVRAYEQAVRFSAAAAGRVYNIGGGPGNALSLREMLSLLGNIVGKRLRVAYRGWRPGDTRFFVSDISNASQELRWRPAVSIRKGLALTMDWMRENLPLFRKYSGR